MTRTLLHCALLSLLSLGLASGCSEDDTPALTEETFCEQWAEAACGSETVSLCEAESAETCQTSQAAFCSTLIVGVFDAQNASGCISAVKNAYSDGDLDGDEMRLVLRLEGACGQMMRGNAGEGGSCSVDKDCDAPNGFECVLKGTDATGTCEAVSTVAGGGDDCSGFDVTCEAGRYCDGSNCLTGKQLDASCTVSRECAADAFCSNGVCTARLAVSTACTIDAECAAGVCFDFGDDGLLCSARARLTRTDPLCEYLR